MQEMNTCKHFAAAQRKCSHFCCTVEYKLVGSMQSKEVDGDTRRGKQRTEVNGIGFTYSGPMYLKHLSPELK